MSTLEDVKTIIADYLDINVAKLTESSNLRDDFGIDSLNFVELVMELEEKFQIRISDEDVEHVETVGELAAVVDRLLPANKK
jgi:acyl carrier protein